MAFKNVNPDWMDQPKGQNAVAKTDWITRKWEDVPYGEDDFQKIDIYLPEEGEGPFPTVVMVHGGGMTTCDKHDFHLYPMFYALQQGFAVVAVNYRLGPHAYYPAMLEDTQAALKFVYENAAEYSIDGDNLFTWGASAGGNLVLLSAMKELAEVPIRGVAALCAEATMEARGGIGKGIGTPAEQVLISLMFFNLHKTAMGKRHPSKKELRAASAFTYLPGGIAPLYIQHGDADYAIPVSQSVKLYEEAKKVLPEEDLVLDIIPGCKHMGGCEEYFEEAHVTPVLDFFRAHIK